LSDKASKAKGLLWLMLSCALGVALAVGITPLVRAVPWRWEQSLARLFPEPAEEKRCKPNPQAEALLARLTGRLYPIGPEDGAFTITVQVVRDPLVNAYAQLGGLITINSGLLHQAQSPEEVAGVLAHEMEHVHHRHILQGFLTRMITSEGVHLILSGNAASIPATRYFLTMRFSRAFEAEADTDGLKRLQLAHIDNHGFRDFFARMEADSAAAAFLSDHPSNESRIAEAEKFERYTSQSIMTAEEWKTLRNYCGQ
jgi:predicted Zn-dependent protease